VDAEVLASCFWNSTTACWSGFTLGGSLSREQLMDGAAAIWLSTIYGVSQASDQQQETA